MDRRPADREVVKSALDRTPRRRVRQELPAETRRQEHLQCRLILSGQAGAQNDGATARAIRARWTETIAWGIPPPKVGLVPSLARGSALP
jgi:hypothetical protein